MSNKFWNDDELGFQSNVHKTAKRTVRVIISIWIAWIIFCLAGLGGIIYVAWHFISKYW